MVAGTDKRGEGILCSGLSFIETLGDLEKMIYTLFKSCGHSNKEKIILLFMS